MPFVGRALLRSLIPLSVRAESSLVVPAVYGAGTALPVIAFALLITLSGEAVGRAFNLVKTLEKWARRITGVLFIAIGVFFSLRYVFDLI